MSGLAPISENEVSVTADLKTAIDPFANAVTSSLGFRLSSILPVEIIPPKITMKGDRIEDYYYSRNEDIPAETVPPDYEKFLEFVDETLVQFYKDHPYRMRVFLTAENEHGTRYFLSSFIRPSVLPLISAHTVELAAQFVANLIEYQILFDFFSPPRCITTPNFTVESQKGDCFDMAILLTTILTGIGYDACVIVGYANRELTLSDLRYRDCPGIAKKEEVDNTDHGPENKYLKAVHPEPPYRAAHASLSFPHVPWAGARQKVFCFLHDVQNRFVLCGYCYDCAFGVSITVINFYGLR